MAAAEAAVFVCHRARCRVALALEEMLGYFTVIFLSVVFFRKWKIFKKVLNVKTQL